MSEPNNAPVKTQVTRSKQSHVRAIVETEAYKDRAANLQANLVISSEALLA